jgi:hypothetical protein
LPAGQCRRIGQKKHQSPKSRRAALTIKKPRSQAIGWQQTRQTRASLIIVARITFLEMLKPK